MPTGAWKEYFVFSKKERVAVFILLGLMVVFIALSIFYTPVFSKPAIDEKVQKQLTALSAGHHNNPTIVDSSESDSDEVKTAHASTASQPKQKELFYFDPNTIDIEGWKRLGFKDKTIENILNYRKTAGNFKKPEDLYNVPRIRKKVVLELLPYIRFGTAANQPAAPIKNAAAAKAPANEIIKNSHYKTVNVNTAVAQDFMQFPGMSDAVAARIVKYRASLNGFTSVDGVAKTYGLADSTFKIMRPYLTISPK